MKVHCVTAKYDLQVNAVREQRVKTVDNIEEAEEWINGINEPAMFYIDGMQNYDAYFTFGSLYNSAYWEEYKKVID